MRKTKTALLSTILGACWTATTLAAGTFTIVRLTDSVGCSAEPSLSGSGKRMAFSSEVDLVPGGNADGNFEIFIRDEKKGLTQVTNTTGGTNEDPAMSKSGTRVAFASDRDLVPGGNADANLEIFLFDVKKGLRQITTSTAGFTSGPRPSAGGKQVAFMSSADPLGTGNADGQNEIYLYDEKKGLTRITNAALGSNDPSISANGARIAFSSNADLTGGNADGNSEIFLFDKKAGFTQVTDTPLECGSSRPAISGSGKRIAFSSTCNLVPPDNGDGTSEIFLFDVKKGFRQLTSAPLAADSSDNISSYPAIDAAGKRVAFFSSADLVPPGNTDLNYELYLFIEKKGLRQLTVSTGGQGIQEAPSMSANGKRIAIEMVNELTPGSNADAEGEIYLITEK